MPITLRTRDTDALYWRYPLTGEYSVDVLNAAKDTYRAVDGRETAEMDFPFPYPYSERVDGVVPSALVTFINDAAGKHSDVLLSGTVVRIDSVKVRRLCREFPYQCANILELGIMQEATHERYTEAAEFFEDFFEKVSLEERDMGLRRGFMWRFTIWGIVLSRMIATTPSPYSTLDHQDAEASNLWQK